MTATEKQDRNQYIISQYQQGITTKQLAQEFDLTEQSIYLILHKAKAVKTPHWMVKTYTEEEDKHLLERIKKENKHSLAKELGTNYAGLYAKKRAAEARMWRRRQP